MTIFSNCKRLIINSRYNYSVDFYNYAAQNRNFDRFFLSLQNYARKG